MALMLLPYWTDGCIGSMEGLFFESSATTPYHFLNQSELSGPVAPAARPAVRRPRRRAGVEHLQMMGVRYYMVFSPEAIAQADAEPRPRPGAGVPTTGGSTRSAGSELVAPLACQPAVVAGGGKGERGWLDVSAKWYQDPESTTSTWPQSGPRSGRGSRSTRCPPTPRCSAATSPSTSRSASLRAGHVSNIQTTDDRISFDVDQVGTPVLVKASYFPNWKAWGAEGPWRVTPNLMVVIPNATHVSLHYGWTTPDVVGWLLTLSGSAWPSSGPGEAASWSIPRRQDAGLDQPAPVEDGPPGR